MITVPKIVQLPFRVPTEVINSILSLRKLCANNKPSVDKWYHAPIDVYTIQWVTEEFLKEKKFLNLLNLSKGQLAEKIEYNALSKCWIMDNEHVTIIRRFIDKYFDTVFGFRIHVMPPRQFIDDTVGHRWPRVFIPAINDDCKYTIVDLDNKSHTMYYKVGNCYLWDVRLPHHVVNENKNLERVIATFMIDPEKEYKLQRIRVLNSTG